MASPTNTYVSAAHAFAALVDTVPESLLDGPGLGEWDLRSLIGHASRSLTTVLTYLDTTADAADIDTPEQYYARVRDVAATMGSADIVERGRRAGIELGPDPAAAVDDLVQATVSKLASAEDRLIRVIGDLGIPLHSYLPTRTFELAVHGLDIATAAGVPFTLPDDVAADACSLAARIAVVTGDGATVLNALTGRAPLPASFSVV
ncbi:maleylpyruvate isomerase N-terminal domain-containing protein [Speluncibacter jeojiensis]|uniref:Maleylpyruvate isomerase N-terminal domain-containing protein n=1 Tax=Speluncibacter jeojiensis TaxID=2710754 RepID=A0A9X4LXP2_9ACTN|nr:maleylpyruvate isomerase N-terminal domain-containing protein [Corynebacteriales bacterium D3-21]